MGDASDNITPEDERPRRLPGDPSPERLVEEMNQHRDDLEFPVKPQKIIWDLRTALALEDIVVCDVGAHKMWMARMFRCEYPNTCIISNGFASMGIAVPGAIAAKLAEPDRRVVAVTGDAGFMMNSQEIETAIRNKLNIVILIWNDSSYGLAAGLWTRDLSRAHRVAARLEAGQIYVNEWITGPVEMPFGGYKQSGYGREKGIEALHHYTQVKCVTIKL